MTGFPTSECRSCHAAIIWGVTHADKLMPVDAEPCADGNVLVLDNRSVEVLGPLDLAVHDRDAQPLRMAHHATCPDVAAWRR